MNDIDIRDYYVGRAEAARRMAEQAASPNIAAIHLELADRYEAVAHQQVIKVRQRAG
jgi:hypothetical protein